MPWLNVNPEGNLPQFGNIALHGGNVEGLASTLAQLRYKQIKDAQDAAVGAAQAMQQNRAANAYIQTAQSSGLVPQGDYGGGVSGAGYATELGKLMEMKRLRDLQSTLYGGHQGEYDAMANYHNAMADYIRSGGKNAAGGLNAGKEWVQDANGQWHYVTGNLAYKSGQGPDVPNAKETLQNLLGVKTTDLPTVAAALNAYRAGKTDFPSVGIYTQGNATPGEVKDKILSAFNEYQTGKSGVRQSDVDQAQQALDANTPLPVGPSAPPPASQVAPGYGVQAVKMQAPDGTVSPVDPNLVEYYKSKGAVIVP